VVHSLETGDERTYLTSLGTTGGGAPIWFHDGKSVMTGFGGTPYRIDLQTADFQKMPDARGALSPDDKTGYVVRRDPDNKTPARVVSVDLNTGQERQIFVSSAVRTPQGLAIALSPDGRTLALGWTESNPGGSKLHIARVSVDGSDFREVFTRPDHAYGGGIVAWSKDGRSILFNQEQPGGATHWGVMRVPAEGGGPATLVFATGPMQGFDPSPDGSRFAYSARESPDELWALDNVLSALK
jgi:Tol biopolymer transport system component